MSNPILLVEDDDNDVFLFTKTWKRLGLATPVQVASDGQQAIDYVEGVGKFADRKEFPLPCLVLLDLKLPRVKGLDVLKRLREKEGPPQIIVILSSSKNAADVSSAYALGANAYLTKPTDFENLIKLVTSIADFWLTHNIANPGTPR